MTQTIEIGHGTETLHLELAENVLVDQIAVTATGSPPLSGAPCSESVASRVAEALAHPEQFLPISDMVVPGDTVAIAVEDGLPQLEAIVTGILKSLERCQLGKIEVVVPPSIDERSLQRLRASLPPSVQLIVHNLADRASLRYLGADEDAEPIRVNRALVDADFVLPVGVMRVTDPLIGGPCGDAMFPGLIDAGQRKRLQQSTSQAIARREHYHNPWAAKEAHQVRWALGVQLMLAVEVTLGGEVGRMIASSPDTLQEIVRAHYADHRGEGLRQPADVVVACVEGDDSQQSLENLMRAALIGRSYAAPEGSIVLVTTLAELGTGISLDAAIEEGQPFSGDDDQEEESGANSIETLRQAAFARSMLKDLIHEIDTSRRYLLLSDCNAEAAEAFGFGVVQDKSSLARLINQHASCCVLRAAQTAADAGGLQAS